MSLPKGSQNTSQARHNQHSTSSYHASIETASVPAYDATPLEEAVSPTADQTEVSNIVECLFETSTINTIKEIKDFHHWPHKFRFHARIISRTPEVLSDAIIATCMTCDSRYGFFYAEAHFEADDW